MTFKVVAPTGWRFDPAGWPGNLASFLSKDNTKIEMDPDEVQANWGTTIGSLDGFAVVKRTGGGGGDDGSPGFGLLVTVIAATGAALLAGQRRP